MLSQTILSKLNDQINMEYYSSSLYLQMSAWCISKGLEGCGAFLRQHAEEEKQHMYRLFDYVNETGAMAIISAIDAPQTEYDSLMEQLKAIYNHECLITKSINSLVDAAMKEKDYSTFNFLQWYVAEQHEEEHLFHTILEKAEMLGTDGRGLYHLDHEIRKISESRNKV